MKEKELAKLSLEETFEKIDDVIEQLQSDEVPLEESFMLYKDGMEMLSHCREVIDDVEKRVIELSESKEVIE